MSKKDADGKKDQKVTTDKPANLPAEKDLAVAKLQAKSSKEVAILGSKTNLKTALLVLFGVLITTIGTNWDKFTTNTKEVENKARLEGIFQERAEKSILSFDQAVASMEAFKTNIDNRDLSSAQKEINKKILDNGINKIKQKKEVLIEKYKVLHSQFKNNDANYAITQEEIKEIIKNLQSEINKSFNTSQLAGFNMHFHRAMDELMQTKHMIVEARNSAIEELQSAFATRGKARLKTLANKIKNVNLSSNDKLRSSQLIKLERNLRTEIVPRSELRKYKTTLDEIDKKTQEAIRKINKESQNQDNCVFR